jgi:hypothetical protein
MEMGIMSQEPDTSIMYLAIPWQFCAAPVIRLLLTASSHS